LWKRLLYIVDVTDEYSIVDVTDRYRIVDVADIYS